jgi:two-component system, OmpR family, sensor histidine kinase KdpD
MFRMRSFPVSRALRCAAAAALSVAAIAGATRLRHVNHTTIALGLVLMILVFSIRWGWLEALVASLAGGLGFDYYLLPPRGFNLEAPEHWITLTAFLLTAITTGQLSARANRHRAEAERRRDEMAALHRLGNSLLDSESVEAAIEQVTHRVVEILGARGAAFFDQRVGRTFRSGPDADRIPEDALQAAAATGNPLFDAPSRVSVVPVRVNGDRAGSLGIAGTSFSRSMLHAVAERVGVALARAGAVQESMAAELTRRSENLKSAVLDALAHEIKGPLATIKVSVSALLSRQPGNAAQQREMLTIIDEEADRIEGWIDDTIQVSHSEAAELRLEKRPNSVKQVVARALEGLGPLAAGRPIDVAIPESLPAAVFDGELIEKVIRLVLDNALKYSPPGSPIGVSAQFTGAEMVLSVADRGCGIPDGERERIFRKHYRGRAAKQGPPGTGLGLASAKCIMEAHGGEIWVTSSPGAGSVFHMSLPVAVRDSDERPESAERR